MAHNEHGTKRTYNSTKCLHKKTKKSLTSNLTACLKSLEQKEGGISNRRGQQEINWR